LGFEKYLISNWNYKSW